MGIKLSFATAALAASLFVLGCDDKSSSTTSTPKPSENNNRTADDMKDSIEQQSDAAKREAEKTADAARENADKAKEQIEESSDAAKGQIDAAVDNGKKLINDIKSAIDNKDYGKLNVYIEQAQAIRDKLPDDLRAELDGLIAKAKDLMPKMP